jgi:hypothetical protein
VQRRNKVFLGLAIVGLTVGCLVWQNARKTPENVVLGWGNLLIYLPPEEDISFIRERLPRSLAALEHGLSHDSEDIRRASAYVAEVLGPEARPLGTWMVKRLRTEPSPVVRSYLGSAIASTAGLDRDGVQLLGKAFQRECDASARASLAGALVRLRSAEREPEAWQWLLGGLTPLSTGALPDDASDEGVALWERCWASISHLRHIPNAAEEVLPLLRELAKNPQTPDWVVEQQVSPAIREMDSRK